jgi:hypothetical protein
MFRAELYPLAEPEAGQQIRSIEQKHPQDNKRRLKFGVVLCNQGQTTSSVRFRAVAVADTVRLSNAERALKEMFANTAEHAPESFVRFLSLIADRVPIESHKGYQGDISKSAKGNLYFKNWNGFESVFHVATEMNSEQHRRLIGNDIGLIFFQEHGPFNPSGLDSFGTVPQVFFVVQPSEKGEIDRLHF